ncbi:MULTISPECIES: DUF6316 family protein [unclassified Pseudomonas]|uniref:DUF6316 family protein n=1 Tax=unclassified Pseudomonas TaxID=196821 RepID=UPI002AC9857A|nr:MULTISPECIES: DUF6316 family protein [unclassified Pseudomonas]MEB0042843.1 DUF6316 family protein [Pseudomonas sp. MH10]MEB0075904.1 DUF6316 family protein [Pseudomonas sp. MH10out]MEB0091540.1 DUF6316 family protein [Pseudomonas sp. CCI4.2]MEB0104077.1 DUF6316 family protein [Pseudomonas sp. CCI3.2]MEB0120450.1 DUF6316 family protein [Pseudomonas sp. CCI1.2]
MFGKRSQDPAPTVHYRSDRVSLVNGQYFFSTRENTLEGPYFTRTDAVRETEAYINRMIQAKARQQSSLNG